jgi:hypothetical protein
MSDGGLTPKQKAKGRNAYFGWVASNVIAFTMLGGSVLILFSLKPGADSFFIGILSAMIYFALLITLIGRQIIRRIGARRQWAFSWFFRHIIMIPIVFAPVASGAGNTTGAMLLILLPFLGFNIFRGIGLVSLNPMTGSIAEGKDRGAFLARTQILTHIILIVTNLFIGLFLGSDAAIGRYVILICVGVGAGVLSSLFILRMPDPVLKTSGSDNTFMAAIRRGLMRPEFKFFIAQGSLIALVTGLANPFLVVYAKRIYALADNLVVFFLVIGNISAVAMGLIVRSLIDRIGGKVLYLIFLLVLCLSIGLLVYSPSLEGLGALIFLGAIFFLYNFGLSGGMNSAQSYFYTITDVDEQLNLGLLNFVVTGAGGAVGSIVGGILLVSMETTFANPVNAFRVFYAIVLVLLLGCYPLILKLKNVGNFSVRSAIEVLLSRKNLRAVALLHKLDTSSTQAEEAGVIDSLAASNSPVAVNDLLERLTSPRFYIRSRALRALENLPLTDHVADALIIQVRRHAFTTGHVAARIMGRQGIKRGTKVLRQALSSEDYLLQAEAALALARLGDRHSITRIEEVLSRSRIPRVRIYAAAALEILKSTASLPFLFDALGQRGAPPYFRDEIILSIAGILGFGDWFYEHYSLFLKHARRGISSIIDYMKDSVGDQNTLSEVTETVRVLQTNRGLFCTKTASRIAEKYASSNEFLPLLLDIIKDGNLMRFDRLAFLIAAILARLECGDTIND